MTPFGSQGGMNSAGGIPPAVRAPSMEARWSDSFHPRLVPEMRGWKESLPRDHGGAPLCLCGGLRMRLHEEAKVHGIRVPGL